MGFATVLHTKQLLDRIVGEKVDAPPRNITGLLLPNALIEALQAFFVKNPRDFLPIPYKSLSIDLGSHLHQVDRVKSHDRDTAGYRPRHKALRLFLHIRAKLVYQPP